MKKKIAILSFVVIGIFATWSFIDAKKPSGGPVSRHGQLSIKGQYVVDQNGEPTQLRGMSMFWSQWDGARFYNPKLVKYMAKGWKSSIIRPAMGVEHNRGYVTHPETEQAKVETVIQAAIKNDIYVLVDFHSHAAQQHVDKAKKFFGEISAKYGKYPNVIYEIYNEPLTSWDSITWYADQVIAEIRKNDPDNIIVVGTPQWSQLVDQAADKPIKGTNIAYTLHFYAATHKQDLRDKAIYAVSKGLPIFVTEFGTCKASGDGDLDIEETEKWMKWMDQNHVSWCNWSICDKRESASAVNKLANSNGNWIDTIHVSPSGRYVKGKIYEGYKIEKQKYGKK